ncbi:amidase [Microbacterium paludicola]|uniref:Amidase n=1 Tax=Microbacterium paludicola TaxID=300019 RepID=A0A4Y9FT86_9MICO|nr:amidase [Microbacterium paludicola]MBF0816855.1 amidase [Microbacterium paludicola]TFU32448.1 amidase [Microbacterium paludicola]
MTDLHELPLRALAAALRDREVTPVEATAYFLSRIEAHADLGAFAEVTADAARERAASLGTPEADPPDLWGVPLADKDLTARAGVPTRYGSRVHADNVPDRSDPLALVLDDAGAISLGKTSTPEFGLTGFTETRIGPPARDPWDPANGAGGSSGGAAVAVAAGLLPAAPASDGGGSIRIPAATVGVVGLKPSRGRVPAGSGLDSPGGLAVAGAIGRSADDTAMLLDVLAAGPHPYATRAPGDGPFSEASRVLPGQLKLGVTTTSPWAETMDIRLDPGQKAALDEAIRVLDGAGHAIEDVPWEPTGYGEMFMTLWRASAARIAVPDERLGEVEPITAWLIREGRALTADRLLTAYGAATAFERQTITAFGDFDAVLTPALALPPQPIGWFAQDDPERSFARQCEYAPYSSFVNVAGLPAITVPVLTDGHPVSVQIIGRPGGEALILHLAAHLERARGPLPWPPLERAR